MLERWRPSMLRPWQSVDEMRRLMDELYFGQPFRLIWRRLPAEEMAWETAVLAINCLQDAQ